MTLLSTWKFIVPTVVTFLYGIKKYFNGANYTNLDADLTGKNAVLTGGNAGIGKETLFELAKRNCNVVIGARDKGKSEEALKQVEKFKKTGKVEFIRLDLNDRASIEEFCKNIPYEKIDYLINNAGVMTKNRETTKDGFEMHIGCNHFGHFLLTSLLWDKITKSDFFRIINVSSLAHKKVIGNPFSEPEIDFDDINFEKNFKASLAYTRSKLANNLFTHALAEKIDEKKGMVVSLHPGVVRTELFRNAVNSFIATLMLIAYPIYFLFTKSPLQGAQTTFYTIFSSQVKNGKYYADCKEDTENAFVCSKNWERLWKISEEKWGIKFDVM